MSHTYFPSQSCGRPPHFSSPTRGHPPHVLSPARDHPLTLPLPYPQLPFIAHTSPPLPALQVAEIIRKSGTTSQLIIIVVLVLIVAALAYFVFA